MQSKFKQKIVYFLYIFDKLKSVAMHFLKNKLFSSNKRIKYPITWLLFTIKSINIQRDSTILKSKFKRFLRKNK